MTTTLFALALLLLVLAVLRLIGWAAGLALRLLLLALLAVGLMLAFGLGPAPWRSSPSEPADHPPPARLAPFR